MKKIYAALLTALLLALSLTAIVGAAEYVYYENDFSDPATLSDFTQYRGEWGIVDGQLCLIGLGEISMDEQAWMLFTKDAAVMNLTDYILEVDMNNIQTQAGPLFRCDFTKALPDTECGFMGYQAFISFTGTKGAIGLGDMAGSWGGNLKVSSDITAPGANLHLKVIAEGKNITYIMTDRDSGAEIWNVTIENEDWAMGSFGFRAVVMNNGNTNLGMLGFDNLKITATGEVGEHLAAGKPLADYKPTVASAAEMPAITNPMEIDDPAVVEVNAADLDLTKTEYVFYENDFSDPATIADFTQYRGEWTIHDGMVYYSALSTGFKESGTFSWILYSANTDVNLLRNYTVDLDVMNSQTSCGILSHCDLTQACSANANSFYGYTAFISQDGMKGAVGYTNYDGGWGGNLSVSEKLLTPGMNYHLRVVHNNGHYTATITEVGKEDVIWSYEGVDADWASGSFGIRSISTKDVLSNLDTVGFDNLKVTVYGDEAVLLHAGYHPNAKIVGGSAAPAETTAAPVAGTDAPAETADIPAEGTDIPTETTAAPVAGTEAPVVTTAAPTEDTDAPVETTAAPVEGTDTPAETTAAPVAPAEDGAPVGLIIGIAAAVIVIAAILAVVLKKKK